MHDRTLRWVNRGHGLKDYIDAVERAKKRDAKNLHPFDPRLSR
jgi:radical SAM superfamily enzyme